MPLTLTIVCYYTSAITLLLLHFCYYTSATTLLLLHFPAPTDDQFGAGHERGVV